jgi:predicted transcriptional regulator
LKAKLKTAHIYLNTTPALKERIRAMAKMMNRSMTYIVEDALSDYLNRMENEIPEILEGLEDIKEGRVTPIEEVIAKWEAELKNQIQHFAEAGKMMSS